jgi:hypothetical protein
VTREELHLMEETCLAQGNDAARLLRGVLLPWLEQRDNLLCELSVEDSEWPETAIENKTCRKRLKNMRVLMRLAKGYAECLPNDLPTTTPIIWAMLDDLAVQYGYTRQVNWKYGFAVGVR